MGFDLHNRRKRHFRCNWTDWRWILKLAFDYGWDPKGTVMTFDVAYRKYGFGRQKNDVEFDPEYELMKMAIHDCTEWAYPGYFFNEYQTVTREDAQNLAAALERALDNEPNLFCHADEFGREYPLLPQCSKRVSLNEIPDSDSALREDVKDFISFCKEGEFRIA
jgi:hypothetical protein